MYLAELCLVHFRQVLEHRFGQVVHQLFIEPAEGHQNIGLRDGGDRLGLARVGLRLDVEAEPGIGDGVDAGQLFVGDFQDACRHAAGIHVGDGGGRHPGGQGAAVQAPSRIAETVSP